MPSAGSVGVCVTEVAGRVPACLPTQDEEFTVGGGQGVFEPADLVAVSPLELGELGGEGADDAAGLVRVDHCRWARRAGLLLGSEVFDPVADFVVAVEEVQ